MRPPSPSHPPAQTTQLTPAPAPPPAEFYRLPLPLLRKALDLLVKRGQAQVLKGLGEDGDGVKFV